MIWADDAVDSGADPAVASELLQKWRAATHEALVSKQGNTRCSRRWWMPLKRFGIPTDLFDAAIDGQLQDLSGGQYFTFGELKQYCYRVASTVGHRGGFTSGGLEARER